MKAVNEAGVGSRTPTETIKAETKAFILGEFLHGEDPAALTDTTPLITGGIVDSIATVKLVAFLEERFGIEFYAHEMSVDNLNTLEALAHVVREKMTEG